MTQDARWEQHYQEVMDYILAHHRMPSKYKPADLKMVNWLKYNRKLQNKDKQPAERNEKFEKLLRLAAEVRHINQYS